MTTVLITLSLIVFSFFFLFRKKKVFKAYITPRRWKEILESKVDFYRILNGEERKRFEIDIQRFLGTTKITGVKTSITLEDRLLVASSAVIPLFGFPSWEYSFLDEVLLYPSSFDRNYSIGSKDEVITGMVGSGPMEGKVILSKPSLHVGFAIGNDRKNVGIHEFVHLFDKEDGLIDGIPPGYESKKYSLPWLNTIRAKTKDILASRSDIDGYATTNHQEFFAVASEYFFEQPHLLKKKHPELYELLSEVFRQDLASRKIHSHTMKEIGRNSPCPCGSGKKFKRCCIE
ncbi:MAG: zinc-dependent peptidase [Ekhidna sp.]